MSSPLSLKISPEEAAKGLAKVREARGSHVASQFTKYQTNPSGYTENFLGITPWKGVGEPGQAELFADIGESVRAQLAGEPCSKVFRVEAGHGIGKTYGAAAIVNWFFDCFGPSIITTTAPTSEQVKLLLWKDIKRQRAGKNLPGRVLPEESRMVKSAEWFAFGRTTSDAGGKGSERAQGQHHPYMLFVLDEAEGVPDFFFDAVDAMMTGGKVILVLMLANPKTRTSRFFKKGREPGVKNYRLSVLNHPNVVYGKEIVEGATTRSWVTERIARWCEIVSEHSADDSTFALDYDFEYDNQHFKAGTVFKPNAEFCFRVLGAPPAGLADNAFISAGRFEQAKKNEPLKGQEDFVRFGVDCARFGVDMGSVYVRWDGKIWRHRQVSQGDSFAYFEAVKKPALKAAELGATDCEIRVDGTGGFGSGVIDLLKADEELQNAFKSYFVIEVQFGSAATERFTYADKVTEMYAEAAETLKGIYLHKPSGELETDLTERRYEYVNREGRSLKKLIEKEKFRKDFGRSPDDGDGFVLAAAPDHLFFREAKTTQRITRNANASVHSRTSQGRVNRPWFQKDRDEEDDD